jgi:hypothetical protein
MAVYSMDGNHQVSVYWTLLYGSGVANHPTIKRAVCRLQLLSITGGRILLHPSHPQRDVDPATLELDEDSSDFDPRTGGVHYHSNEDEEEWGHPEHLIYRLRGMGKLGEIAWIARPLLYGKQIIVTSTYQIFSLYEKIRKPVTRTFTKKL